MHPAFNLEHLALTRRELLQRGRSAAYRPVVQALCAQRGVGPLSAIRIVLELGRIERFASGAALAHYLGVTPSQYSSGELDHRGDLFTLVRLDQEHDLVMTHDNSLRTSGLPRTR